MNNLSVKAPVYSLFTHDKSRQVSIEKLASVARIWEMRGHSAAVTSRQPAECSVSWALREGE